MVSKVWSPAAVKEDDYFGARNNGPGSHGEAIRAAEKYAPEKVLVLIAERVANGYISRFSLKNI